MIRMVSYLLEFLLRSRHLEPALKICPFVSSYSHFFQYTANAQGAVTERYSFSIQGYLADRMHAAAPVF